MLELDVGRLSEAVEALISGRLFSISPNFRSLRVLFSMKLPPTVLPMPLAVSAAAFASRMRWDILLIRKILT